MSSNTTRALKIKEALAARNMTQADLCRITGIGKSAMSQYVNGSFAPRQDRTFLIAKALDVSEAWLMGFDVPMERKTPASPEESERIREFSEVFGKLTPEQQALIIRQIKGILSDQ